ncbi:transmembrane protein 32 [Ceratocystis lukuohia]|uniref:Transmembrane protein 32 n=1 Tax=Ceratocystis lukuohia TaxID=2019550 RepID=A0ABR4MGK0_9PEZI
MSFFTHSLSGLGLVLLIHACYSAQEHTTLQALRPTSSFSSLPLDIVIETIAATMVLTLGLILSAPTLRPINWRVWAGKLEREGPAVFSEDISKATDIIGNPFFSLESRPSFIDIRGQRKNFAKWTLEQNSS